VIRELRSRIVERHADRRPTLCRPVAGYHPAVYWRIVSWSGTPYNLLVTFCYSSVLGLTAR
jgi:hypothetical protein